MLERIMLLLVLRNTPRRKISATIGRFELLCIGLPLAFMLISKEKGQLEKRMAGMRFAVCL